MLIISPHRFTDDTSLMKSLRQWQDLEDQDSDVNVAIYHNLDSGGADAEAGSDPDNSRAFLTKLFSLRLINDVDVDITKKPADMGLDLLIFVELRAWLELSLELKYRHSEC
ncbi:hypothetical protein PENCOP_c001G05015 [Penicillium coprophilum]|uniref:Uncharacterized protein n=1 Tax=Penicillium coprophilum TaxID=36646 RepID=A0A1V6VA38_9EURO|nr:hypothetical protein PENCOP_c001G05015 [Penicillium coprophilum]